MMVGTYGFTVDCFALVERLYARDFMSSINERLTETNRRWGSWAQFTKEFSPHYLACTKNLHWKERWQRSQGPPIISRFRAVVRRSEEEDGFGRVKDGLVARLFLVGNDQGLRNLSAIPQARI